jgi:hypothetical protein
MRNLFVKISEILQSIEREKGEFLIKCLVSRETDEPYWDLILSADWFSKNPQATMSYLTDRIMNALDYDCLMFFSGIIPYPADTVNPLAQTLMQIQRNHREHLYELMRLDGIVMLQTQLEQARLVVPIDDDTCAQSEAA